MWLHIPNLPRYHSAAESPCSITVSTPRLQERLKRSFWWRGKHSAWRIWLRRWNAVSFLRRISGLTLKPSQAQRLAVLSAQDLAAENLTSLLPVSLASRGVMPENGLENLMTAIYGQTFLKQLRSINPALSSSRMWTALRERSTEPDASFAIWKKLVISLRRDYSARRKSAARIFGADGSFWGSPRVSNNAGNGNVRTDAAARLEDQAIEFPQNWKSPTVGEEKGRNYQYDHGDKTKPRLSLLGEAEAWPSPQAENFRKRGGERNAEMGLDKMASTWPTARARDGKDDLASRHTLEKNARPSNEMAVDWPTPDVNSQTRDMKTISQEEQKIPDMKVTIGLPTAAQDWPSPSANLFQDGEDPQTWMIRREELKAKKMNGNGAGLPLAIAALTFGQESQPETTSVLGELLRKLIPLYCQHSARWQSDESLREMSTEQLLEIWKLDQPGKICKRRLNANFAAWLMNIPQLRAIGNSVDWKVAMYAFVTLYACMESELRSDEIYEHGQIDLFDAKTPKPFKRLVLDARNGEAKLVMDEI